MRSCYIARMFIPTVIKNWINDWCYDRLLCLHTIPTRTVEPSTHDRKTLHSTYCYVYHSLVQTQGVVTQAKFWCQKWDCDLFTATDTKQRPTDTREILRIRANILRKGAILQIREAILQIREAFLRIRGYILQTQSSTLRIRTEFLKDTNEAAS